MASSGWIKLYRQLLDNELWQEARRFSRAEAWIDLLLAASHRPYRHETRDGDVDLAPGQVVASVRRLADRWNWSRNATARFLDELERREMVRRWTGPTRSWSVLEIVNWDRYQGELNGADPDLVGTPKGTPTAAAGAGSSDSAGHQPGHPSPDLNQVSQNGRKLTDQGGGRGTPKGTPTAAAGAESGDLVGHRPGQDQEGNNTKDIYVKTVMDYWQELAAQEGLKRRRTDKRRKHVQARLADGFSVEELKQVLDHAYADPWMRGANPNGRRYLDIENIFTNTEKVERRLDWAKEQAQAGPNYTAWAGADELDWPDWSGPATKSG